MFIYLASPYSHPSSFVRFERYIEAMKATRWLIIEGHSPFSPIVHCHPMTGIFEMPTDALAWERYNYGVLDRSEGMYVLALIDWGKSKGIAGELKRAREQEISCKLLIPNGEEYVVQAF